MKILFIVSRYSMDDGHSTLEKEMVSVFHRNGHDCTVITTLERKYRTDTTFTKMDSLRVLQVKVGNLYNDVSFLEKKLTLTMIPYQLNKAAKTFLAGEQFDFIVAYGPYLSSSSIICPLKRLFKAKAILMQWDIFPQNAIDLDIIKNKCLQQYLFYKQKVMLAAYDLILCNSPGVMDYLSKHFQPLTQDKLNIFRNCEMLQPKLDITESKRCDLRLKYRLAPEAAVLIFGGNIGIPQSIENIVELADALVHHVNIQFLIVGQGGEAKKIQTLCARRSNIQFYDYIPKQDYEQLVLCCDIGIVSLSPKLTVPNFPAKITSYLKCGLPVLACTDNASYADVGQFLYRHDIGVAVRAGDIKNMLPRITDFILQQDKLAQMKQNTRGVFDKYFDIDKNFHPLMAMLQDINLSS
jgi:Glycosyl transferases group 1